MAGEWIISDMADRDDLHVGTSINYASEDFRATIPWHNTRVRRAFASNPDPSHSVGQERRLSLSAAKPTLAVDLNPFFSTPAR